MSEKTFKINGIELEQLDVSAFETSYTGLEIIEINNKGAISEVWRKAYPCEITVDSEYLSQITINHNGTETSVSSGTATIYIPINSTSSTSANVLTITCENGDTYTLTAVAKNSDYDYKYYFDTWVTLGEFGRESCSISTSGHKTEIPYITITFTNAEGSSWSEASYTVKSGSVINDAGSWKFSVTDINGQVYTNTFTRGSSDNYYVYDQDSATVEIISDTDAAWPYTAITDTVVHGDTPRDFRTYGIYLGTHTYDYIGNNWGDLTNDNTIEGWDAWQALETSCWDNNAEGTDKDNTTFRSTDIITIKRQDLASSNNVSYVKVEREGVELYKWTITKNANLAVHGLASFHLNGNNKNEILAGDENCDAMITGEFGALKDSNSGWFTSSYKLDIYAYIGQSAQWSLLRENATATGNRYNGNSDIAKALTAYTTNTTLEHYPTATEYPIIVKFDWINNSVGSSNSRGWLNLACAPYAIDKESAEVKLQAYDDTLSMKLWANRGSKSTGYFGGSRLNSATIAQRKY